MQTESVREYQEQSRRAEQKQTPPGPHIWPQPGRGFPLEQPGGLQRLLLTLQNHAQGHSHMYEPCKYTELCMSPSKHACTQAFNPTSATCQTPVWRRKPILPFFRLGHVWKWIPDSSDADGKSQLFNMLLKSVIFLKTVTVRLVPGSPWQQDGCSGRFARSCSLPAVWKQPIHLCTNLCAQDCDWLSPNVCAGKTRGLDICGKQTRERA